MYLYWGFKIIRWTFAGQFDNAHDFGIDFGRYIFACDTEWHIPINFISQRRILFAISVHFL